MSSREAILNRVAASKPAATPLPDLSGFGTVPAEDRLAIFTRSFESAGGVAVRVPDHAAIGAYLQQEFRSPERILTTLPEINFGHSPAAALGTGHEWAHLEMAVVRGRLGVAENGAIWVSEADLPLRVLPFICEHLVLVVDESSLVGTMHEAYAQLEVSSPGYGVFIAGPSRTADIEQSLVIGAHGPKRAHVFILAKT